MAKQNKMRFEFNKKDLYALEEMTKNKKNSGMSKDEREVFCLSKQENCYSKVSDPKGGGRLICRKLHSGCSGGSSTKSNFSYAEMQAKRIYEAYDTCIEKAKQAKNSASSKLIYVKCRNVKEPKLKKINKKYHTTFRTRG